MNRRYLKSAFVFGVFLVMGMWASVAEAQYYSSSSSDRPLITVKGEAEVRVTPDRVIIVLEIGTSDNVLIKSREQNDEVVGKIEKIVKKHRIDAANLQVDRYSFNARYYRPDTENKFLGYEVKRTVAITLSDVSRFEDLMTDLITAGADRLTNIQFRTTELKKYRDQARALAVNAARDKAVKMAGELSCKIGKPFNITENRSSWYSWYGWSGSRGRNITSQISVDIGPPPDSDQPVGLGKISVTASVNVTFELE